MSSSYPIAITPEIRSLVAANAPVCVGVSGGKDSQAAAIRLAAYLDEVGHMGPKVLIHSDLGRVEWQDSLPVCERLARRLGWELMVVRRLAGDMMDRWETRWRNNVERYASLSCVKLILPWSTPSMRFCTSELKTAVICSAIKKRFPNQPILSVTGVRRDESTARAKMPVAHVQPKLSSRQVTGYNWNPIIDWPTSDVYAYLEQQNEPLHEAYRVWGSTRVSCAFCIMGAGNDLQSAATCPDNHAIYREMVDLEVRSTFAFQGSRWLADVAPRLLDTETLARVQQAKVGAKERAAAEALLPKHLLYTKGWPDRMPTLDEAQLISDIRKQVAGAVGIHVLYTRPDDVRERYAELMAEKPGATEIEEEFEGQLALAFA